MKVVQLTVHFPPNIGGVETHLSDLVTFLSKKGWHVFVLCYRPLSARVGWKIYEKESKVQIFRIPWLAGLFYKLIPHPKLEFLYLSPGLFIFTPIVLLINNPQIIHAHGLIAGFVATFWGRVFNKKIVISTHSLYSFPKSGLYKKFANFIFNKADKVLCLSNKSFVEILNLGVNRNKVIQFTYWIDLNKFTNNKEAKKMFAWKEKFIVLFVGRLILEKGIDVLLESVKTWDKGIGLVFVGTGPMESIIIKEVSKNSNIHFLGKVGQESLANVYSAADILIVPSTSEEGFGRVIMESLSCGTPVVVSNKGAIPEVIDESVGKLIDINPESIKNSVEDFFKYPLKLANLSKNARKFAERRYSEKNGESIIRAYSN